MAVGLLVSSVAAGVALLHGGRSTAPAPSPSAATATATETGTAPAGRHTTRTVAVQPSDFAVAAVTYDPGQSSGWHVHPGVHAVHVLSGTLKIYDENCGVRTVGPDQSYVGGRDTHLARNEGAEPVRMVVTYVEPGAAAPADLSFRVPGPANCV